MPITVTDVTEIHGTPYEGDRAGKRLSRQWHVTLSETTDEPAAAHLAAGASGIPLLFSAHPTVPTVIAKKIRSAPASGLGGNVFVVTLEYDNVADGNSGTNQTTGIAPGSEATAGSTPSNDTAPDARTPTVRISSKLGERRPQKWERRYQDGDPFVYGPLLNTADEPLEIVLGRPMGVIELQYYRPTANFYDTAYNSIRWNNCVNSDTWAGFPAWVLKVSEKSTEYVFERGATYRRVTLKLDYDPRGHILQVANVGLREKVEITAGVFEYRPILDSTGAPVQTPVPLNLDGTKRTSGDVLYIDVVDGEFRSYATLLGG